MDNNSNSASSTNATMTTTMLVVCFFTVCACVCTPTSVLNYGSSCYIVHMSVESTKHMRLSWCDVNETTCMVCYCKWEMGIDILPCQHKCNSITGVFLAMSFCFIANQIRMAVLYTERLTISVHNKNTLSQTAFLLMKNIWFIWCDLSFLLITTKTVNRKTNPHCILSYYYDWHTHKCR